MTNNGDGSWHHDKQDRLMTLWQALWHRDIMTRPAHNLLALTCSGSGADPVTPSVSGGSGITCWSQIRNCFLFLVESISRTYWMKLGYIFMVIVIIHHMLKSVWENYVNRLLYQSPLDIFVFLFVNFYIYNVYGLKYK